MIKKAAIQDLPIVAELACRLWPEHTPESLHNWRCYKSLKRPMPPSF